MAPDADVALLQQKVAVLEAERCADRERMDRMEKAIEDGFARVEKAIAPLGGQLTELNAWMNRSKGWAAAALLLAGLVGALVKGIIAGAKHP